MGYVNVLGTHVSVTSARHDKVARQTAVSTVTQLLLLHILRMIDAESSPVVEEKRDQRMEDEANTVLEALSVVLCANLLEPSHVELIGCIDS